jgi:hypothetical protein
LLDKDKKFTFLLVQQAQNLEDFASTAVLVMWGQQSRREGLVWRIFFGDKAIDR